MGYIKKRIAELIKEHGGKIKASRASIKWFQDGIKSKQVNEAQETRNRFEPGKIYVFEYKPKYKKELPWFDLHPVVLAIEQDGANDFGINLNLLPLPFKEKLLDELYTKLKGSITSSEKEKSNALKERPLKIDFKTIKDYLKKNGYDFALRQYIPSRKRKQSVVSYSKWPDIALCDFIELKGINVMQLRLLFNDYFKKNI